MIVILFLAFAIALLLLGRFVLVIQQLQRRNYTVSWWSDHDVPLEFPQGCPNCRAPTTLPWIYKESPESLNCTHCQTNFRVSFVPGGVSNPPSYEWEEQNSCSGVALEALVGDCPNCRGKLSYYVEHRHNSSRHPTARCRSCGCSESL